MSEYPKDEDIKIQWSALQLAMVIVPTMVLWGAFFLLISPGHELPKTLLTLAGLNLDIVGVIWASRTPPYYGIFVDGGEIERKRSRVQDRSFRNGMAIVGVGFLLQGISAIL
ncbi:hypothetical protein [Stenotrophomonas rhizophila]